MSKKQKQIASEWKSFRVSIPAEIFFTVKARGPDEAKSLAAGLLDDTNAQDGLDIKDPILGPHTRAYAHCERGCNEFLGSQVTIENEEEV